MLSSEYFNAFNKIKIEFLEYFTTKNSLNPNFSFNMTNVILYTYDLELSNLRNLEVLIVRENRLNGSLPFKGKIPSYIF